ncbi:phosphate ABC transporter permease subunit PstC [Pontiellaceae bacterium B1224]|nr:phosphate ABC transporter permease subunit PstC [Pontiellaceae bacterium B1224]
MKNGIPSTSKKWFPVSVRLRSRLTQKVSEAGILSGMGLITTLSVLLTLIIIIVLGYEASLFFQQDGVSVRDFLTGFEWNPLLGSEKHFGIWPLVCGTLLVAVIALLIAVPAGLLTAVFLSEYANPRVRAIIKPALEVLAGIPTVVYGFLALTVFTPGFKLISENVGSYNALSAGVAVGILILPIITSLSEDALRAVPNNLREGALGLGATPAETSFRVILPAALSGIISSILLAAARAIGETMIVALAAGNTPKLTLNPGEEIQTMTGFMVQMALGDVSNYGVEYLSMYAVALTLFIITLGFTLMGAIIRRRYREEYQ